MDTELFELCKSVYDRTKWGRMDNGTSTDLYFKASWVHVEIGKADVVEKWRITGWGEFMEVARLHRSLNKGQAVPYYTTDYILEKLPDALNSPSYNIAYRLTFKKIGSDYFYEYSNHGWFRDMKSVFARKGYDTSDERLAYAIEPVCADTPIKALLKLVIALDEAKQLTPTTEREDKV